MAALGWKTLAGGGITALHVERETALPTYVGTRAWVTGDGPKVIFADAVRWLRDRDVLAVR